MRLTAREEEIARLVALGHTDKEVARRLGISLSTARCHLRNIRDKLGIHSRVGIALHMWERRPSDGTANHDGVGRGPPH